MPTGSEPDLRPDPMLRSAGLANDSALLRNLFLALIGVLLGFGTLMVYSSSVTSWPTDFERVYLSKHLVFLTIGISAGIVASSLPVRFWYRIAPLLYLVTLLLLIAVFLPSVGVSVNGSRRWLGLGPVRMQPSELAKLTLPLLTARLFVSCRHAGRLTHPLRGTVPLWFPTLILVPLVFAEPDLGTAIFLGLGTVLLLWSGGWPLRFILPLVAIAIPAAGTLLQMKDYQRERIAGFVRTWGDWTEAPYQLKQSLLAFGRGGIEGTGLGRGWQKLSFLPEANTDFVVAVIGEELGLIGTLGLIAVWVGVLMIGLRLIGFAVHRDLSNHPDPDAEPLRQFATLTAFVLLVQIVMQAAINVAVVTAMVPPKGISHPLISAGGSNLIVTLVSLGVFYSLVSEPSSPPSQPCRDRSA